MKNVLFQEKAYEQFMNWLKEDEEIFWKINALIQDISRDYFRGLGKSEPLKHNFAGYCGAARAVKKNNRRTPINLQNKR